MAYTDAPACKLLATHCVACGRPLLDASSVELGMGPDCRKRLMVVPLATDEQRSRANFLVWEMAMLISSVAGDQNGLDQVARITVANNLHELRAMGYDKLASKLEDTWVCIKITEQPDGTYAVKMPYSEEVVTSCRRIRGRRWDGRNKVNTFPMKARPELWQLLIRHFPGYAGMGPKGSFVVPNAEMSRPSRREAVGESDQEPVQVCKGCEECDGEGGHFYRPNYGEAR